MEKKEDHTMKIVLCILLILFAPLSFAESYRNYGTTWDYPYVPNPDARKYDDGFNSRDTSHTHSHNINDPRYRHYHPQTSRCYRSCDLR